MTTTAPAKITPGSPLLHCPTCRRCLDATDASYLRVQALDAGHKLTEAMASLSKLRADAETCAHGHNPHAPATWRAADITGLINAISALTEEDGLVAWTSSPADSDTQDAPSLLRLRRVTLQPCHPSLIVQDGSRHELCPRHRQAPAGATP